MAKWTVRNLTKLNRVTKSASKIIGVDVDNVKSINEAALLSKLKTIELDNTHPLHKFLVFNRSGRIRQLKSNTNRCRLSFLPTAFSCFNKCFTRYTPFNLKIALRFYALLIVTTLPFND